MTKMDIYISLAIPATIRYQVKTGNCEGTRLMLMSTPCTQGEITKNSLCYTSRYLGLLIGEVLLRIDLQTLEKQTYNWPTNRYLE